MANRRPPHPDLRLLQPLSIPPGISADLSYRFRTAWLEFENTGLAPFMIGYRVTRQPALRIDLDRSAPRSMPHFADALARHKLTLFLPPPHCGPPYILIY